MNIYFPLLVGGAVTLGLVAGSVLQPWSLFQSAPTMRISETDGKGTRPRIVLFGDSITQYGFDVEQQGWAARLASAYQRKADVVDRGYSGYNTRWALYLLDALFPLPGKPGAAAAGGGGGGGGGGSDSGSPLLVVVFFGANDMTLKDAWSGQHVPVEEYRENLCVILGHIRAAHGQATRIVLVTPGPVCYEKWAAKCAEYGNDGYPCPDRTSETAREYAEACKQVAQETSTPVVDLFQALGHGEQVQACDALVDGLHFAPPANAALFSGIQELVKEHWPEAVPEALPLFSPEWSAIDRDDPGATFAAWSGGL